MAYALFEILDFTPVFNAIEFTTLESNKSKGLKPEVDRLDGQ